MSTSIEQLQSEIASLREQSARLEAVLMEIRDMTSGVGNCVCHAVAALAASSLSPEPSGAPPEENREGK